MKINKEETHLCHGDKAYFQHHGAIVPPIYQTSLFAFESWDDLDRAFDRPAENYICTVLDNTWASPIFQKPLDMGIEIEVHSVSKYIGGHNDVVAGLIVGDVAIIDEIITEENAFLGAVMSPFEAWLILRSLRTLSIRMLTHQKKGIIQLQYL